MEETRDMVRISGKFHDRIQAFCSPLVQNFGISHFYHARITSSGHFLGVNLNREWEEYFFSNKSHLLIWPDKCQPCKTHSGVRLLQENENEDLNALLKNARDNYSINFSLQFVEKSNCDSNMYGFALNSSDPIQHMKLIKELPLLRLFIRQFQEEFKTLYTALDDNKVDLPSVLGPSFYKIKNPAMTPSPMRNQFLKDMGIEVPITLTDREVGVIHYLIEGCSACQIACALQLSKRTVEHHIERIKDKFHACSKSALIQKARQLESVGYFLFG